MFDNNRVIDKLSNVIGWKNHYDLTEIAALPVSMNETESGEFYQDLHPAMRLDIIKQTLPLNRDLSEYLKQVSDASIVEVLNDIVQEKQISHTGKDIVANDVIYNQGGFRGNTVLNEGRFVGVRFRPTWKLGLMAEINRFALQFTDAQTNLDIYVYHTSKLEPLLKIPYTTTVGGQFNWVEAHNIQLFVDEQDISGGEYFIGYYQDDITGNAVKYEKLNWRTGYCRSCDGGTSQRKFNSIAGYVNMQSFYLPSTNIEVGRKMFDPDALVEVDTNNWGFNFNISVKCDLTSFFIDNRKMLQSVIGLKTVQRIIKDISYSTQINSIDEQIKNMIIRDLEGDKETNYINIPQKYEKAIQAAKFSTGGLNSMCLPQSVSPKLRYGVR